MKRHAMTQNWLFITVFITFFITFTKCFLAVSGHLLGNPDDFEAQCPLSIRWALVVCICKKYSVFIVICNF
mgnify:CR=1 FL=1